MAGTILEKVEWVQLRASNTESDQNAPVLILTDTADVGKVLLLFQCYESPEKDYLNAIDANGQVLFSVSGMRLLSSKISSREAPIGSIHFELESQMVVLKVAEAEDEERMMLKIEAESAQDVAIIVVNEENEVLATFKPYDRCESIIDIKFKELLSSEKKVLIVAMAVKVAIGHYKVQDTFLPTIDVSLTSQLPKEESPRAESPPPPTDNPLDGIKLCSSVVRATGYNNENNFQYYDVIDTNTKAVTLTLEVDTLGEVIAFNRKGEVVFQTSSIIDEHLYHTYFANGQRIGYFEFTRFFDNQDKDQGLYIIERDNSNGDSSKQNPLASFDIFAKKFTPMASIVPSCGCVEVTVHEISVDDNSTKVFLLAHALRVTFLCHKFNELPMPQVRYYRGKTDDEDPMYLFTYSSE